MRLLALDIETSPALVYTFGLWNQNHGLDSVVEAPRVLCFSYRWHGEKKNHFYSEWEHGREGMLQAMWDALDEATHVMHYNGKRFDIPWLNAEFVRAGINKGWPPSPYKQVDLMREVKRNFYLLSNKLQFASTDLLQLGGKVQHQGMALWRAVMDGDPKAQALFKRYCRQDVDLLIEMFDALLPWLSGLDVNLEAPAGEDRCSNCGGTHLQWRGWVQTKVSEFARFQCQTCGTWGRSTRRTRGVTTQRAAL